MWTFNIHLAMRLINVHSLETVEFSAAWPEYAILSHRWQNQELSYHAYQDFKQRTGPGFTKIQSFCNLVKYVDWAYGINSRRMRLDWAWIDTCCIDKTSSAELSEAINSMWNWYQDAAVCVAYIYDSPGSAAVGPLQELLAPKEVFFYTRDWTCLGQRNITADLRQTIVLATSIADVYLQGREHVARASIAQRMSWASARKTTRGEDLAYCLFGLFSVHMPLLYGEGQQKAFYRLQEQIVRQSNDESIFAFGLNMYGTRPALASGPQDFVDCESVRVARRLRRQPYTINNSGLEFRSPTIKWHVGANTVFITNLNCGRLVRSKKASSVANGTSSIRLRGCIMVLRQMGDVFVRDLSWEKKVEDLDPANIRRMHGNQEWVPIEDMRFNLAATVDDVYSAEIDERQNALNIGPAHSGWYEDNDGPMFWGFTTRDRDLKDVPADYEDDTSADSYIEAEESQRPITVDEDVLLGPFELSASPVLR